MRAGALSGSGGARLHTQIWEAAAPRGRALLVHGLGEHAGRYAGLARALQARGYSVFAHDHRGHGRSEGRRGYVARFEDFVDDLALAAVHAESNLPGPGPLFLYGHSMGALVLIRYLQVLRPAAAGAVLSAPWLATAVSIPWWKVASAAVLRRVAPGAVIPSAVDPAQLTADPTLQQAYSSDPLVSHGISVALYDAVVEAQRLCWTGEVDPRLPALVLLPMADPLIDLRAVERWAERLGPERSLVWLPGRRHEPHNDVGREEVYRLIADWMDDRTPEAAAG